MSKGFYFIRLPRLVQVAHIPTSQEELAAIRRPLQLCTTCRYVLCSCGNCHNSELCNEICLYAQESEEGE